MTPMQPRMDLRNVRRVLASGGEPLVVLDDVSLVVAPGELVAILGASGSGKSTLLAVMAGLDRPTAGEVHFDGRRMDALSEDALALWRRRSVGFVFQSFQLLANATAFENVLLPLELIGADDAVARANELLDRVGLAARATHYPAQLSGGEQQRIAVARAFAHRPSLLLADEPTGNLDAANGARILDLIERLRAIEHATVVLVTHDGAVASRADRCITLRDGRVVPEHDASSGE
jgi:putative ABC transport system ATP-binding protein